MNETVVEPNKLLAIDIACNAHGLYCVPLYDTLGAGAVEYILCHSEISIAFAEEKKIPELLKTFPNATQYLKSKSISRQYHLIACVTKVHFFACVAKVPIVICNVFCSCCELW
ncbi:Long chain acyl-CoA synthetase 5 [Linum perenne]